jgi:hypothetical protein
VARQKLVSLAVAVGGLGLLTASSFASPKPQPTGHLKVLLKPCCSTIAVRPGQPPPHYAPRWFKLEDKAGTTVVRKEVPMGRWTVLAAPIGRYHAVGQGCSSADVRVTTDAEPRVRLRCPVP